MSIIDELITNRTQADVTRVRELALKGWANLTEEEKAEWNAGMKGAYNATDLNRVTQAMDYINAELEGYGYVTGYQKVKVPHEEQPVSPLPDGYVQLEYIESTGTQYINTGFTPNQDTRVVCDVVFPGTTGTSGKYVFGSRTTLTQNSYTYFSYNSKYETTYNTQDNVCYQNLITGRFIVDKNKNITTTNGTEYSHTYANFTCPGPLYLFALNNNGSLFGGGSLSLYSCQIYDNDVLIRDFVPCINPGGEVGLYDLVNGVFYGNAGTGAFTAGPDVPQAPDPEPERDPYLWYEDDIPTPTAVRPYLANVGIIKVIFQLPKELPEVPTDMDRMTQDEANAIETILAETAKYIQPQQEIYLRSGMAVCGDNLYFAN